MARVLDQIARAPSRYQYDDAVYLALNSAAARLRARQDEAASSDPGPRSEEAAPDDQQAAPGDRPSDTEDQQVASNEPPTPVEDVLDLLWDTALHLEDGRLSLAERELRDLEEALRQALEQGASDEELERLLSELQRALDAFLETLPEVGALAGQLPAGKAR